MGIEVNFEGKIALITGASSGLGARFAKALAGARVRREPLDPKAGAVAKVAAWLRDNL